MNIENPYGSDDEAVTEESDTPFQRPAYGPRQPQTWFVAALNSIVIGIVILSFTGMAVLAGFLMVASIFQ